MSKMLVPFKAAALSTVAALALASFAVTSAFAASPAPTATSTQPSSAVLQSGWKAETSMLSFDGAILSRFDKILDMDRVRGDSVRLAGPKSMSLADVNEILGKAHALVGTHAGFDSKGAVTDAAQGQSTIQTLGQYLDQLRGQFLYQIRNQIRFGLKNLTS